MVRTKARRSRLMDLRESVAPILSNRLHTHFTDHSVVHSDRVAELAQQLAIPLKGDRKLNDAEAFVLYGAAYLHDVGMHNENAGLEGRLAADLVAKGHDWMRIPREEKLNLIRTRHHEISADMVSASLRNAAPPIGLTLTDQDHPSEIASLCEAHCVDTRLPRYRELVAEPERSTMRLRLLSALLRLADILDEAHHRALVEQARTLSLTLESRMHWWRHYYTRDVVVEPDRNRITIWFGFPVTVREEYTRIIPPLQMPWVEQEMARHREVLAEYGLSWHVGWQVQPSPFSSVEAMPAEVKGLILQEIAGQKRLAAERSRLDVLKHFDEARGHVVALFDALNEARNTTEPEHYLREAIRFSQDLTQIGSRRTARNRLRSATHFATTNGRSVSALLHVRGVTALGRLTADDGAPADALRELVSVQTIADSLPDAESAKAEYYSQLASIAARAGYDGTAGEAAIVAMRLLRPGLPRDLLAAELAEAELFFGTSEYRAILDKYEREQNAARG